MKITLEIKKITVLSRPGHMTVIGFEVEGPPNVPAFPTDGCSLSAFIARDHAKVWLAELGIDFNDPRVEFIRT